MTLPSQPEHSSVHNDTPPQVAAVLGWCADATKGDIAALSPQLRQAFAVLMAALCMITPPTDTAPPSEGPQHHI